MTPTASRIGFLDWMKCLGIILIVHGHVAGWGPLGRYATAPIYSKQIGVVLFLIAAGYTLAREKRPSVRAVYNRLFEVYLFGIAGAVLYTLVAYPLTGNPAESNYLPYLLGVNVALDFFPANPTTWFIGTYLHVLLVWALFLRGVRIRPWMIAVAVIPEILIRATLMESTRVVPYMILPNWTTAILIGLYLGQHPERDDVSVRWVGAAAYGLALAAFSAAWVIGARQLPIVGGPEPPPKLAFPFIVFDLGPPAINLLATSAIISLVYATSGWLIYQTTRRLPTPGAVRFLARGSLIIFIAHMPVHNAMIGLEPYVGGRGMLNVLRMLVCLPGLAACSELIHRLVQPARLREWLWCRLSGSSEATARPLAAEARPSFPEPLNPRVSLGLPEGEQR